MAINIKTAELERIFSRLIEKLRDLEIKEIEVNMDYYSLISTPEWSDFSEPHTFCVGSLDDDWKSLKKIIEDKDLVMFLDFDRTSSILRAISETIIPG